MHEKDLERMIMDILRNEHAKSEMDYKRMLSSVNNRGKQAQSRAKSIAERFGYRIKNPQQISMQYRRGSSISAITPPERIKLTKVK